MPHSNSPPFHIWPSYDDDGFQAPEPYPQNGESYIIFRWKMIFHPFHLFMSHATVMQQTATTHDFIYKERWILSTTAGSLGGWWASGSRASTDGPSDITSPCSGIMFECKLKAAHSLYNSAVWRFENSTFACTKSLLLFFLQSFTFFFLPIWLKISGPPEHRCTILKCAYASFRATHYRIIFLFKKTRYANLFSARCMQLSFPGWRW